jgi:hypothetical protein
MKWVLFVVLFVAFVGGAVAMFFPMSVAADFLAKQEPDFRFEKASGSVWSGKLTRVRFGQQDLGDVSVKTDPVQLFKGAAAGVLGVKRPEYEGRGRIVYGLKTGEMRVSDLIVTGNVAAVPGLPQAVRLSGGTFRLVVDEMTLGGRACETASGQVWTDALTRVVVQQKWTGPELRGPVTCEDGRLVVLADGMAATGEQVTARINVGGDLELDLTARVEAATPAAVQTLSKAGFTADGSSLVLRRSLGSS